MQKFRIHLRGCNLILICFTWSKYRYLNIATCVLYIYSSIDCVYYAWKTRVDHFFSLIIWGSIYLFLNHSPYNRLLSKAKESLYTFIVMRSFIYSFCISDLFVLHIIISIINMYSLGKKICLRIRPLHIQIIKSSIVIIMPFGVCVLCFGILE